jgi:hypothetical protein
MKKQTNNTTATSELDYRIIKTQDDIENLRGQIATDQYEELIIGAETWGILYDPGQQRGQMLRLPNGRGAVEFGADSEWGDWDNDILTLDEAVETDDGYSKYVRYNTSGEEMADL